MCYEGSIEGDIRQNPRVRGISWKKEGSGVAYETHIAGRWFVGMRCEHARDVGTLVHWERNEMIRKRAK